MLHLSPSKLRTVVFGVEDSLVSTVGLLSGIAVGAPGARIVLITGVVLVFVEAFSMAIGSFLAEYSAEELAAHREVPYRRSVSDGALMFLSYFVSGFIPLAPYLLLPFATAFWASIAAALSALAVLGAASARVARVSALPSVLRMAAVGGLAILIGVIIGAIAQRFPAAG